MGIVGSNSAGLTDGFGRAIRYLRVGVTDRCDLRCTYCMPKGFKGFEEPEHWLTFEEIERVVGAFAKLGVSRVRLTGGEPLLRRNIADLAQRLGALTGIDDLSMTTNGTTLAKHAQALRHAGVRRLNISLDSLSKACVTEITGREDAFDRVMQGLEAAQAAGFAPIKINMVVMSGVNDAEIADMVKFCLQRGFVLRLIETMPVGETARQIGSMPLTQILEDLKQRFVLVPEIMPMGGGPARYWRQAHGHGQIGVITPISQHFCETCNRVRLDVSGTLYLCLGQDDTLELRPLLRAGISDTELSEVIKDAVLKKPWRHEFNDKPEKIVRFMSQTGG
ncbi:GTP 3',8-cyclase MoaA [Orrella daihaiensis]|uniref:GTP 3',8-cyclase n=2 Tax=Orrella daihaiensis TaxID=2782176 RepID=A0ABY4AQ89_9BURK|nr:GTP 3',8-cyclase MoaA [Orrella daihaiensis]